jgi:hypothetical protein
MSTAPPEAADLPDPAALLRGLSADAICDRLDRLEAEGRALRVLLRSVRARERLLLRRGRQEAADA